MTYSGLGKALRIGTLIHYKNSKGVIENSFQDLFGVTQYVVLNQRTGRRDTVYEGEVSFASYRKPNNDSEQKPAEPSE